MNDLRATVTILQRSNGRSPSRDAVARGLLDRLRTCDPEAWEHLYRRIYPRLCSYVSARISRHEVDDVVSETMSRAVAGVRGFRRHPSGLDAWIFGIARNVTADHHRAAGRSRRLAHVEDRSAAVAHPGEALETVEERARVRAAFSLLSTKDRDLLELRVIAGLSADEVAIALGKRPGAVRTAQSRALDRLRTLLEREP